MIRNVHRAHAPTPTVGDSHWERLHSRPQQTRPSKSHNHTRTTPTILITHVHAYAHRHHSHLTPTPTTTLTHPHTTTTLAHTTPTTHTHIDTHRAPGSPYTHIRAFLIGNTHTTWHTQYPYIHPHPQAPASSRHTVSHARRSIPFCA